MTPKGLLQTAAAEHKVANYAARPTTPRNTASPASNSESIAELIPLLLSTVNSEAVLTEDGFQAQTCLGWIHWVLSEPGLTVSTLPKEISSTVKDLISNGKT